MHETHLAATPEVDSAAVKHLATHCVVICTRHLSHHTTQGETWQAVIRGHEVDPMAQQQDQQRLMLERFQREVSSGKFGGRFVGGGVKQLPSQCLIHCRLLSLCLTRHLLCVSPCLPRSTLGLISRPPPSMARPPMQPHSWAASQRTPSWTN